MKILFANIGWMTDYQGNTKTDYIKGGGSWNNARKHEVYNFQSVNGWCYGYVQPAGKGKYIDLRRIDKKCRGDVLDDVLVIWMAPLHGEGSRFIVGWYEHATVYRYCQNDTSGKRSGYGYFIKAKAADCTLLPVIDRTFYVPKKKYFSGQANVWYADKNLPEVINYRQDVWTYVNGSKIKQPSRVSKTVKKVDPNAKKKVEKAAIKYVTDYYKSNGYVVTSVEKENKGWDLEAEKGDLTLLLEVKGLAGNEIAIRITENEFKKLTKNTNCYLCVVTDVLKSPMLFIYVWDKNKKCFVPVDGNGPNLNIDERPTYYGYPV